jgi:hypothetical protein
MVEASMTVLVYARMKDGSVQKFQDDIAENETWEDVWKNVMVGEEVASAIVRIK